MTQKCGLVFLSGEHNDHASYSLHPSTLLFYVQGKEGLWLEWENAFHSTRFLRTRVSRINFQIRLLTPTYKSFQGTLSAIQARGSACSHRIDAEVWANIIDLSLNPSFFHHSLLLFHVYNLCPIILCTGRSEPALSISWLSAAPELTCWAPQDSVPSHLACFPACSGAGGINRPTGFSDLTVFLRIFVSDCESIRTSPLWNFVLKMYSVLAVIESPEPWHLLMTPSCYPFSFLNHFYWTE